MAALAQLLAIFLIFISSHAAKAGPIVAGDVVVTTAPADLQVAAGSASRAGSQPAGSLGIAAVRAVVAGVDWWQVDFFAGVDGWLRESRVTAAYFPPPEASGGWRSLASLNATPTALRQADILRLAGVDWSRLLRARQYSASFATGDALLVIRNGLTLVRVDPLWLQGVYGLVILVAITIDAFVVRRTGRPR